MGCSQNAGQKERSQNHQLTLRCEVRARMSDDDGLGGFTADVVYAKVFLTVILAVSSPAH